LGQICITADSPVIIRRLAGDATRRIFPVDANGPPVGGALSPKEVAIREGSKGPTCHRTVTT
jgi:hypothetical protein